MNSKSGNAILEPFRLDPSFVERVWGVTDLRPWYDFVVNVEPGHNPIGEVWMTGDDCRVSTGTLAGLTLSQVFAEHSRAMLGDDVPESVQGASPLLMKVIFAREKLSVQVHPDDRLARKYGEPRGKTECWYALAAEPHGAVAAGLKPGTTLEQVEREVADGTLESSLEILPVAAGDMVFVDAGTVHAIWPGSVLLETQQNSDLTYRLYDYGRPRPLHLAKALEAIRLETAAGKIAPIELTDRTVLLDREYFRVEKMVINGVRTGASMTDARMTDALTTGASSAGAQQPKAAGNCGLTYLFAAGGSGRVAALDGEGFEAVELPTRGMVAVPAASPAWQVEDLGGLELIRITPQFPAASTTGAALDAGV